MSLENLLQRIISGSDKEEGGALAANLRKGARVLQHKDSVDPIKKLLNGRLKNPEKAPIGWVFLLNALARNALPQEDLLWFKSKVDEFIVISNRKIVKFASQEFVFVLKYYTKLCVTTHQPLAGVSTLKRAVVHLRPSSAHITALHASFVQLCLLAHAHHYAKSLIDEEVWRVDAAETGIDVEDVLLYLYYAGMACCGTREFVQARRLFAKCLSVPARVVSAIQLEAYKKWTLVSLIVDGKRPSLPSSVSPAVSSHAPRACDNYCQIARAATDNKIRSDKSKNSKDNAVEYTGPTAALQRAAAQYASDLLRDGNMGLLKQAITAITRQHIKKQTRTYVTMSLNQIAERVGLENTKVVETELISMMQNGEIFARISQEDGMVFFDDSNENYRTVNSLQDTNAQVDEIVKLGRHIRLLDEQIQTSESYLKKSLLSGHGDDFSASDIAAMHLDS